MTRRRHDVHVVFEPTLRRWRVMRGSRTASRHRRQSTAIGFGRRAARRDCVELVTHARTGRIRSKDSYGREGRQRDSER
jgi:hypothetical protein